MLYKTRTYCQQHTERQSEIKRILKIRHNVWVTQYYLASLYSRDVEDILHLLLLRHHFYANTSFLTTIYYKSIYFLQKIQCYANIIMKILCFLPLHSPYNIYSILFSSCFSNANSIHPYDKIFLECGYGLDIDKPSLCRNI